MKKILNNDQIMLKNPSIMNLINQFVVTAKMDETLTAKRDEKEKQGEITEKDVNNTRELRIASFIKLVLWIFIVIFSIPFIFLIIN